MRIRTRFDNGTAYLRCFNNDRGDKVCYSRLDIPIAALEAKEPWVGDAVAELKQLGRINLASALGYQRVPSEVEEFTYAK